MGAIGNGAETTLRAGQARKTTSIRQWKCDLKPTLICERDQRSSPSVRNEIARMSRIGDLVFLVIPLPWGKLPAGCQEEK
ncbi:hypothetical protein LCM4577_17455 [Mesorhizobium sp. LCM 4577]|nr:hypothetical protein LCM4577_17455 [Mesorhizobium sp. LCM 4577]